LKVSIEEIAQTQEEEVIVKCHEISDDILDLIHRIKIRGSVIIGYEGEKIHRIHLKNVYYFETVDSKTFIYCKDKVYESKQRLYELEQIGQGLAFFRATKSTIINASKILNVKPSLSGRFEARLANGETVIISRQFVPVLKKILDL